jgi:hypothetical protein
MALGAKRIFGGAHGWLTGRSECPFLGSEISGKEAGVLRSFSERTVTREF